MATVDFAIASGEKRDRALPRPETFLARIFARRGLTSMPYCLSIHHPGGHTFLTIRASDGPTAPWATSWICSFPLNRTPWTGI